MLRASLAIACVWVLVTLVAGLVMQAELVWPGIQVYFLDGEPAPSLHREFWSVHATIAISAVPVTALGTIGCLHLSSFRKRGSPISVGENIAAGALILLGGVFVAAALFQGGRFAMAPAGLTPLGLAAVAISVVAASLACFRDQPSRRASAPWLVFALFLAVMAGAMRQMRSSAGIDTVLSDTYFTVAIWHAAGGALVLLALGLLSAVARRAGKHLLGWLSAILAGVTTLAWAGMVISQAQLGLVGMPRLYADYPELFSPLQARAGLCAVLAVLLGLIAVVRLAVARPRPRDEGPAAVF